MRLYREDVKRHVRGGFGRDRTQAPPGRPEDAARMYFVSRNRESFPGRYGGFYAPLDQGELPGDADAAGGCRRLAQRGAGRGSPGLGVEKETWQGSPLGAGSVHGWIGPWTSRMRRLSWAASDAQRDIAAVFAQIPSRDGRRLLKPLAPRDGLRTQSARCSVSDGARSTERRRLSWRWDVRSRSDSSKANILIQIYYIPSSDSTQPSPEMHQTIHAMRKSSLRRNGWSGTNRGRSDPSSLQNVESLPRSRRQWNRRQRGQC